MLNVDIIVGFIVFTWFSLRNLFCNFLSFHGSEL